MSNRAGKREREARNRHKRSMFAKSVLTPNGPVWIRAKLSHKKAISIKPALVGPYENPSHPT